MKDKFDKTGKLPPHLKIFRLMDKHTELKNVVVESLENSLERVGKKYKKSIDCSNPKGFSPKSRIEKEKEKSENVMKLTKSKLKEMIEEEYFNYLVEKNVPTQPAKNGLIISHKQKESLMYIHQHMQMLGLLNNIKKLVVVGKKVNNENHRKKRNLLGWI